MHEERELHRKQAQDADDAARKAYEQVAARANAAEAALAASQASLQDQRHSLESVRLAVLLMEAAIGRQAQSGGIGMDRGDGSRSESLDDESGSMSESERSESEAGEDDESDSENMV